MTPPIAQPVLVYTRIAENQRKTVLLVILSVLALVPFIVGISYGVSYGIVRQVNPPTKGAHERIDMEEADYHSLRAQIPDEDRQAYDALYETRIARQRAELARREAAEDPNLMLKIMLVVGAAVTAALVLLFWGIARQPAAKLLSAAGAWPAGSGDVEAVHLIENLAIGAGLPTPKLYVIESNAPNAFAAGMSPDRAMVAVTRGALKLLDRRELEGVLAHEISHIGNRDIRLNTIAASVTLFLRIPYLMFRRQLSGRSSGFSLMRRSLNLTDLAMLPLALYILVVAPIVGTLIRAAISRQREFLADADAALLTRYPEGLMRALAKIGGAGSGQPDSNPAFSHFYFANPAMKKSWFSDTLLATHPRLEDRIQRLVAFGGAAAVPALEAAVKDGRQFAATRAAFESVGYAPAHARDELDHLNQGNPMGRVFRVISSEPVPVYYEDARADSRPVVTARIKPGGLIVAFDDLSKMRQINTADETFAYIARSVKLLQLDNVIPAEIYDPKTRAAVEASLPPLGAVAVRATPQSQAPSSNALTTTHIVIIAVVFVAVLVGMFVFLKFAG